MTLNAAKAILTPNKTALLICDMQEKFANVIFEFNKIVIHSSKLVKKK
jgi:isochorismate hydrolase